MNPRDWKLGTGASMTFERFESNSGANRIASYWMFHPPLQAAIALRLIPQAGGMGLRACLRQGQARPSPDRNPPRFWEQSVRKKSC